MRLTDMIAENRRGDAVKQFMQVVGAPGILVTIMRFTPAWSKLTAVAHTLVYDTCIVQDNQRGRPLPATRWASVAVPTLVAVGEKSPAWMKHSMEALANVIPRAKHHTLDGQTHMVTAKAQAPMLVGFFKDGKLA